MTEPDDDTADDGEVESASTSFDRGYLGNAIPAALLGRLLGKLDLAFEAGRLARVCETVQADLDDVQPGQRLGLIFKALQLRGVQVSQLHWVRFDQRRLPALMYFEGEWQVVDRVGDAQISLTRASGALQTVAETELSDCMVVWVRRLPRESAQDAFSLRENPAAQLVIGEVFKSRRWIRDVSVATLVVNVLAISTSLFALQVYDRVVPTLAYATLTTLVVGMAIVVSLDWALKTIRARILDSVSSSVDRSVSQKVFDHVMHLQLDSRPRSLGTLAAQVGGLDLVRHFFTSGVIFGLVDMPFALMFIALIAFIGGPVALVYLGLLPVAVIVGYVTQLRLRRLMREQMMRSNERQGLLVDAIHGAETIRANSATWRFSEQWSDITQTIAAYNIRQRAISSFATVTTGSLATVAYIGGIVVGVGQIEAGNLTMGGLIACTILGGRIIAPISQSVNYLSQWQSVVQALQMVSQVLKLPTERAQAQTLLVPDELPRTVELERLKFAYPDSPVTHLNIAGLRLSAGERVALLGPLGSGKSTLLKIVAGLYRPVEGRIRLGDADLWEIDPQVVADQVGYLPQNVDLFKGTLKSNLALSGSVNDSTLLRVCRDLGVDRIARDNPRGMDLLISEGGDGLSGGQRQLVGLARILIARPRVWLLDEPTSSLDNQSEQQVLKAIEAYLGPDDILLMATHRPRVAMQLATRVVVMQRGEIKLDGPADQVMPEILGRASAGPNKALASNPGDRS